VKRTALLPIAVVALAAACTDTTTTPTEVARISAAIVQTVNPAFAPSGTHLQTGAIGCSVNSTTLAVTCTGFELAGVGHTNLTLLLTAVYRATIDCNNPSETNKNNPIESHTSTFSATSGPLTIPSTKNGRLTVPQQSVSSSLVAQGCPNPNWEPVIRSGTLQLLSFTYTITFQGFSTATQNYVKITGP